MSKTEKFREALVKFLVKHDVAFNCIAFVLALIAIPISLAVFPDATMATFVIAALSGLSGAAGSLSASLMTADERKKEVDTEKD